MPEGVADGHDQDAPRPRLDVLARDLDVAAFQRLGGRLLEGGVHRFDGDDAVVDAEILGELLGVGKAVVAAVAAGHGEAVDVVRSQRVGGQDGDDGGVDPAREPQHDAAEAALGYVIAQPELQGGRDAGHLVSDGFASLRPGGGVDQKEVLLERLRASDHRPVGGDGATASVEDQLIVSADLVDVDDRRPAPPRLPGEEVLPQGDLAGRERTGGHVDHDLSALLGQQRDGVLSVEFPPQRRSIPQVLADGQPDLRSAQLDAFAGRAGLEVTRLVEDVVGRQEALDVGLTDGAAGQ